MQHAGNVAIGDKQHGRAERPPSTNSNPRSNARPDGLRILENEIMTKTIQAQAIQWTEETKKAVTDFLAGFWHSDDRDGRVEFRPGQETDPSFVGAHLVAWLHSPKGIVRVNVNTRTRTVWTLTRWRGGEAQGGY